MGVLAVDRIGAKTARGWTPVVVEVSFCERCNS